MHIIDERLQALECPVSLFVPIAGIIGRTRLTQGLQNEKPLDQGTIDKLVQLLDEMAELKRTSAIMPNWSDAESVREMLGKRREIRIAFEYDTDRMRQLLESSDGPSS